MGLFFANKIDDEVKKEIKKIKDDDIIKFIGDRSDKNVINFVKKTVALFNVINIDNVYFKTKGRDYSSYNDFVVLERVERGKEEYKLYATLYIIIKGGILESRNFFENVNEVREFFNKLIDEKKEELIFKIITEVNLDGLRNFLKQLKKDEQREIIEFLKGSFDKFKVILIKKIKEIDESIINVDEIKEDFNKVILFRNKILKLYSYCDLGDFVEKLEGAIKQELNNKKKILIKNIYLGLMTEKKGGEGSDDFINNLEELLDIVTDNKRKIIFKYVNILKDNYKKAKSGKRYDIKEVEEAYKNLMIKGLGEIKSIKQMYNFLKMKEKKSLKSENIYDKIDLVIRSSKKNSEILDYIERRLKAKDYSVKEIKEITGGVLGLSGEKSSSYSLSSSFYDY